MQPVQFCGFRITHSGSGVAALLQLLKRAVLCNFEQVFELLGSEGAGRPGQFYLDAAEHWAAKARRYDRLATALPRHLWQRRS